MQIRDLTLSEEIIDKLTVWACTTPRFTLGTLSLQAQRSRVPPDYANDVAKALINKWKKSDKIGFVRSRWEWKIQ